MTMKLLFYRNGYAVHQLTMGKRELIGRLDLVDTRNDQAIVDFDSLMFNDEIIRLFERLSNAR